MTTKRRTTTTKWQASDFLGRGGPGGRNLLDGRVQHQPANKGDYKNGAANHNDDLDPTTSTTAATGNRHAVATTAAARHAPQHGLPTIVGAASGDPLQQYHSGWSIFADEGPEGMGSASSNQGPLQQQPVATGPGGAIAPRSQQQQQPYLPRQATTREVAPAATTQWNSGWSPTHQPWPQHAQPQQGRATRDRRWGRGATHQQRHLPMAPGDRDTPQSMTPTRTRGMKMRKLTRHYLQYKATCNKRGQWVQPSWTRGATARTTGPGAASKLL